ncbi:hypothetical protein [Polyangium jinanense]|uniref:Uncharacterized protein n=1 Tax=Polyangium jinanense TaxID=2829994 RepID=A0A9X3XGK2_9BACT|nr:hypothetical protein [Polyangium jinanense]MDC3988708.1 hypothetical protein [Polyangium jinanense]
MSATSVLMVGWYFDHGASVIIFDADEAFLADTGVNGEGLSGIRRGVEYGGRASR